MEASGTSGGSGSSAGGPPKKPGSQSSHNPSSPASQPKAGKDQRNPPKTRKEIAPKASTDTVSNTAKKSSGSAGAKPREDKEGKAPEGVGKAAAVEGLKEEVLQPQKEKVEGERKKDEAPESKKGISHAAAEKSKDNDTTKGVSKTQNEKAEEKERRKDKTPELTKETNRATGEESKDNDVTEDVSKPQQEKVEEAGRKRDKTPELTKERNNAAAEKKKGNDMTEDLSKPQREKVQEGERKKDKIPEPIKEINRAAAQKSKGNDVTEGASKTEKVAVKRKPTAPRRRRRRPKFKTGRNNWGPWGRRIGHMNRGPRTPGFKERKLDPMTTTLRWAEKKLMKKGIYPIGSRRRRVAIRTSPNIPFEHLPYQCFQEALKILRKDRHDKMVKLVKMENRLKWRMGSNTSCFSGGEKEKQRRVKMLREYIDELVLLTDANDPEVKRRSEDGLGGSHAAPIYCLSPLFALSRAKVMMNLDVSCFSDDANSVLVKSHFSAHSENSLPCHVPFHTTPAL